MANKIMQLANKMKTPGVTQSQKKKKCKRTIVQEKIFIEYKLCNALYKTRLGSKGPLPNRGVTE